LLHSFFIGVKTYFLKRLPAILISFLLSLSLCAQVNDTVKMVTQTPEADTVKVVIKKPAPAPVQVTARAPVAQIFRERDFFPLHTHYSLLDTTLDKVQRYFPNNYPFSLGLASRKLVFEPDTRIGFRSGLENLDLFGFSREEIKYYRTRAPYTEVMVLFGQKKEQFARVLHTQNITRQWNVAVNLLRVRSEGFYQRQIGTDNNASLSSNYTSRNNRYSFLINGTISAIKTDENGGILNDSLYENNLFVNKKLVAVNLLDARSIRNSRGIYMAHFLNFGKADTGKVDSTHRRKILPHTSLSYSLGARGYSFEYFDNDPLSGYYDHVYFDSTYTHDSTHVDELEQGLALQSILFKRIKARAGIDQKSVHLGIYHADSLWALDTSFADLSVHAEIGNASIADSKGGVVWNIHKRYVMAGPQEGDDYYSGMIGYQFKKQSRLSVGYSSAYHSSPFIYNYYSSNHFWWSNSFDKITEDDLKLIYTDPQRRLKASVEMISIINYVYLDSTASPVLSNRGDYIGFYALSLQKNFRQKHFGFDNDIRWNSLSQAPEVPLHIPSLVTHNSLFYYGKWFKKAVDIQFGFDVTYSTSYYADAYMPSLGHYYWQDQEMFGNYPYVDFFFNMKVKHARIFFKTEHLNSGLMGTYYLLPKMPAPDRSIKVGINWMFFD
jgi:hypothetical protein